LIIYFAIYSRGNINSGRMLHYSISALWAITGNSRCGY
jgi:hypothetical protein